METCQSQRESLVHLFIHTSKLHRDLFRKLSHSKGLEQGQPIALAIIASNEGISQRQLSEKMFITPASATAMLQKLEKSELVERQPDPNDQRAFCLYMTKKGHMVNQQMKEGLKKIEKTCFQDFSQEELQEFRRLILKFHDNIFKILNE